MKKFLNITGVLAIGMMAAACSKEMKLTDGINPMEGVEYEVNFRISAPGNEEATRAGSEVDVMADNAIANAYIIVMGESATAGEYVYKYGVPAPAFATTQGAAQFNARLTKIDGRVKLMVVANYTPALTAKLPAVGTSEDNLRTALAGTMYSESGYGMAWEDTSDMMWGDRVPMVGEVILTSIVQSPGTVITIPMVRMMARVDIQKNLDSTSKPFEAKRLMVMNLNSHAQLFPDRESMNGGDPTKILYPSVPTAAATSIECKQVVDLDFDMTYLGPFPYVPEQKLLTPDEDKANATCVVVGGYFNGESAPSYYRVDFNQNTGRFGEILRNHRYMFTITSVTGRGYSTPEEAVRNLGASSFNVVMEAWDESESDLHLGNSAEKYLKVEKGAIMLGLPAGEVGSSFVKSNAGATYQVWQNGAQVTNIANLQDFNLTVSDISTPDAPSSYNFTATTLADNSVADEIRGFEVRVFWNDGTQVDTIKFGQQHAAVHILSAWDSMIGSLGVWSAGGAKTPTGYSSGMRTTLINPAAFGPTGTVKVNGVALDEITSSDPEIIPVSNAVMQQKLDWADILLLHYNTNFPAAQIDMIREWSKEGNHVLFISGEGDDTNLAVRQDPYLGGGLVWYDAGTQNNVSANLVQGTIDDLENQMLDLLGLGTFSTTLTPISDKNKGVAAPLTPANTPFVAGPFGTPVQENVNDSVTDGIYNWFSPGTNKNIIPVMLTPIMVKVDVKAVISLGSEDAYAKECMLLGVDPTTRIVYMGDSQFDDQYYTYSTSLYSGNFKKIMDNTWAWAVKTAMGIE